MKDDKDDGLRFEGLTWEVVLTEDAWNKLHSKKVPPDLKRKAISIIKRLASGEMRGNDISRVFILLLCDLLCWYSIVSRVPLFAVKNQGQKKCFTTR